MPDVDLPALRRAVAGSPRAAAGLEILIASVADLEARLDQANERTSAKGRQLAAMTRDRDQWKDVAEARDARLKADALCACSERRAEAAAPLSPPEPRSPAQQPAAPLPGA